MFVDLIRADKVQYGSVEIGHPRQNGRRGAERAPPQGGGTVAATAKQDPGQAFRSARARLTEPPAAARPFARIMELKKKLRRRKAALGGSARPPSEGSGTNSKSRSTTLLDQRQAYSPGPSPPAQLNPSSCIPSLYSRLRVIPTRARLRLRGQQRNATNSRQPPSMLACFRPGPSSSHVLSRPPNRSRPTLLGLVQPPAAAPPNLSMSRRIDATLV